MKMRNVLRQVLAAVLCLCMCAGLVETALPAFASEGGGKQTNVYVVHLYLNEEKKVTLSGYIDENGYGALESDSESETPKYRWVLDTENRALLVYPQAVSYYDKDSETTVTEENTGFERVAGGTAVSTAGEGTDDYHFVINYDENVPDVVLYLFYSYDGRVVLGTNFGVTFAGSEDLVDGDVLEMTAENKSTIIAAANAHGIHDLDDVVPPALIYNTAQGLHTEKRAEEDGDFNDIIPGRTYDVTLEAWATAENNVADVGLILDASGSMAFIPEPTSEDHQGMGLVTADADSTKEYQALMEKGGYALYQAIPASVLDEYGFLNTAYTDNSPLSYANYSYYIYDDRETVRELVPLGYWNGEEVNNGESVPVPQEGLVGAYQFDPGDNFLKNWASADGGAITIADGGADKYKENDYKKEAGTEGKETDLFPEAGAIELYPERKETGGSQYTFSAKLDAEVTDPTKFTISFAVRTENNKELEINSESPYNTEGPRAQDLVTIENAETDEVLYTILRGAKGEGNSKDHVRWVAGSGGSTPVDVKKVFATSKDTKANYSAYSNDGWRVFTFVVDGVHVTTYIDGKKASYTDKDINTAEGDVTFSGAERLSFTLGGVDTFVSGPYLQMDEVYIFDGKALNEDEVSAMVTTMKTYGENVGRAKAGSGYAAILDEANDVELNLNDPKVGRLGAADRAGWYYVNSTSEYNAVSATGSGKSLNGIISGNSNKFPDNMCGGKETSNKLKLLDGETEVGPGDDTNGNLGASPCLFYFANIDDCEDVRERGKYRGLFDEESQDVVLRCVFYAGSGHVEDTPVFVKQSRSELYTKAQMLQIAVNSFINRLQVNSPDSKVGAVRFSTDNFSGHDEELLLQKWTNSTTESTGMMNLGRNDGDGMTKAQSNDGTGQYNYVLTGGTFALSGLKAFKEKLAEDPVIKDDDRRKYLVLFTDGVDDSLKDLNKETPDLDSKIRNNQAVILADELKNKYGYKIFVVRLVSGDEESKNDESGKVRKFLTAISSDGIEVREGEEQYYKTAYNDADLREVFDKIVDEMPFKLTGYTVKDYLDPRFDLVADIAEDATTLETRKPEIIHLHKDGWINIGENPAIDIKTDGKEVYFSVVEGGSERVTRAKLKYDSEAAESSGLYYLEWEKQNIPQAMAGATSLTVWSSIITLRAKEDFIGGNALLTNGPESAQNMVYHPDDEYDAGTADDSGTANAGVEGYPSRGFPRTQVNVKPYDMVTGPVVDVRYLGESIDPMEALKALFNSARGEIHDLDHLLATSDGSLAPDGSGYYFEYVWRYLNSGKSTDYAGETLDAKFDTFLTDLLTKPEGVMLPYSFLPAVDLVHDHATQTGSAAHEADVVGTITYTLTAEHDDTGDPAADGPLDDEFELTTEPVLIDNTDAKRYKLTVTFAPDPVGTAEDPSSRAAKEKGLITDTAFHDPKDPVGTEWTKANNNVPGPGVALHTTYVVNGELALKVDASQSAMQKYLEKNGSLALVLDRTYNVESDAAPHTFTITADDIASVVPAEDGSVVLYLTDETAMPLQGLRVGDYTLQLDPAATQFFTKFGAADVPDYDPYNFANIPDQEGNSVDDPAIKKTNYIAPEESVAVGGDAENNTVTFHMGMKPEDDPVVDRAKMAENLAKWVDGKIEARKEELKAGPAAAAEGLDEGAGGSAPVILKQEDLNALELDPTWVDPTNWDSDPAVDSGNTLLASYLYDRLGMAVASAATIPQVTVTLQTTKTLDGGELTSGDTTFTFTLTPDPDADPNPLGDPAAGGVTATAKVPAVSNGPVNVVFPELKFIWPGTYNYILSEQGVDTPELTYDPNSHKVRLVIEEETGHVTATVDDKSLPDTETFYEHKYVYDLAADDVNVTFTNTYKAPTKAEVTLGAMKRLDGGATPLSPDQFTFRLWGGGDVDMTARNAADGTITFDAIEYTDAGEYKYDLYEVNKGGGYVYDTVHRKVVVTVTKNTAANQLEVTSVTVDGVPVDDSRLLTTFDNTTSHVEPPAPGEVQGYITGTKRFVNGSGLNETFTFTLTPGNFTPDTGAAALMGIPGMDALPMDTPAQDAEATAEPEATAVPEVTAEPEVTAVPEVTAPPETDVTPEPEVTAEPEMTAAPEPEVTPVPEPEVQPGLPEGPSFDGDMSGDTGSGEPAPEAAVDAPQIVSLVPEDAPAMAAAVPEGEAQPAPDAGQAAPEEQMPPSGETVPEGGASDAPAEGQPPALDSSDTDMSGDAGYGDPAWGGVTEGDSTAGWDMPGTEVTVDPSMDMPMEAADFATAPLPDGASGEYVEVTTTGSGSFAFGPITFREAGTYIYTVTEMPGGAGNIVYDNTSYKVTFVVSAAADGTLTVSAPQYAKVGTASEERVDEMVFTNTAINKTSDQAGDVVRVGETITYTVDWANFSGGEATVEVTELFDPGVTYDGATFHGAKPSGPPVITPKDDGSVQYVWTFNNQKPGATGSIDITVVVNEKAFDPWDYASGTLEGVKPTDETPYAVHNKASVGCNSDVRLTPEITNTVTPPDTGNLTISKTVLDHTGVEVADDDTTFTFTVTVAGAGDKTYGATTETGTVAFVGNTATVTLKGGQSVTITGLPAGATYTVTETDAKGYTPSSASAAGNIMKDDTVTAAFTNTKPAPRTGSLSITKTVTGSGDRNMAFEFTVTVAGAEGSYTATGPTNTVTFSGGTATVSLKHGETITIYDLPAGASYSVAETSVSGYTTTPADETGNIPDGGTAAVTFTNYKPGGSNPGGPSGPVTGSLSITKTVTGAAGETDREFHFTVTMPSAAGSTYGDVTFDANGRVTLTVRAGQTVTIYGLPANASYTVTEAEADTDGYTTSATGANGTIPAGSTAIAAFTNDRPTAPSPSPSASPDPGATPGPSASPDPDATPGPSASPDPDATPGPSASPDPDATPSPVPTLEPGVTSEPFGTPDPNATPGPSASPNPDATPGPSASPNPGVTPSPGPSANPGATPSPAPTLGPGVTSEPFGTPTPGGGGNSGGDTPAPRTGDETSVLPWVLMLIASGACLAAVLRKKKHF